MRGVLLFLFSIYVAVCFGQLKHDANWVFGINAGVNFTDTGPEEGTYNCYNREVAATFSNYNGNLLFYVAHTSALDNDKPINIHGADGDVIDNGYGIYSYSDNTAGATFIPVSNDQNKVYLITTGNPNLIGSCVPEKCNDIYYSIIDVDDFGFGIVSNKNIALGVHFADERIIPIKHSNGKDWWLLSHEKGDFLNGSCSNTFFRILLDSNGVSVLTSQDVGASFCHPNSVIGDFDVSSQGNFLSIASYGDSLVDVYKLDRCLGLLQHLRTIVCKGDGAYGVCFSHNERYLYLSGNDSIFQIDIHNIQDSVLPKVTITSNMPSVSQMQLAPDGKIYMAQAFKPYLGVINNPDSAGLACNYIYNGLPLDSGTYSIYGLPNMPNYNLGPLPIYQASAGVDTFYCQGDSTIKALPIGGDSLPNITYQWQPAPGIDSLTARTQLVFPSESRWYYVTITDTSYIGPSCNSRIDSVYVEVRVCTGITETHTLQAKLYPNPTNGLLTVEVPQGAGGYTFRLFNLLGQQLLEQSLEHDKTTFPLDFAKGIYLYQITTHNGQLQFGKLVVRD